MRKGLIILLLVFAVVLSACEEIDLSKLSDEDLSRIAEKAVVCEKPYIRVGIECCLDQNDNKICDRDEPACNQGESLINGKCCIDQNQNRVCDSAECNAPYARIGRACCLDKNKNGVCDSAECNAPYARIGGACCLDKNKNKICDKDEPACDQGESLINGKCCLDKNQNGVCDSAECNAPYARIGGACCLDKNKNKICDKDEPTCNQGESLINGKCYLDKNQNRVCDSAECNAPYARIGGACCLDKNKNKICDKDEPACDQGESLIDGECCMDENNNEECDSEECDAPYARIGGECCLDENDNGVCDVDETADYLFYDDFSDGYLESNWQALYGTPEIDNSKGEPTPSLKLTDRTLLIGDTSPFNSENGLEMSVMVNVDDFDDNGLLITIRDQVRGGAAASLKFNKGQQEGEIMFWYFMYPIDSVSTVLGTDVKTNDHKFHEYKFVIDPDGKAAWYRDGVQKKRLAGAARIPQGDMFFQFQAYNDPVYIDNVIIK